MAATPTPGVSPIPEPKDTSTTTGNPLSSAAGPPKPFSLPGNAPSNPAASAQVGAGNAGNKLSPMETAQNVGAQKPLTAQQLTQHMSHLSQRLGQVRTELSEKAPTLKKEHYDALNETSQRLSPDISKIAHAAGNSYVAPQRAKGDNILHYLLSFIEAGQGQMQNAVTAVANKPHASMTDMLSMQYASQRASQKIELMSNIIGATVSGVKTLMSMQGG